MKNRFSTILAVAVGLGAVGRVQADDGLTMDAFVHSIPLQVSGYTNELGEARSVLADFPVLVRIGANLDGFQYSDMRSTKGGDLAFFAEDGTRLASEVDTWTTGGTSLAWVKLPSLAQGAKFHMCYRLTDELASLDTRVVNDNPWGDYVGVWHLKETGGSGKTVADSTANALSGTTYAGSTVSAGAVGAGRTIAPDNSHAYGIVVDTTTDGARKAAADSLGTDFAASFWMKANGSASDVAYNFLIDRRKGEQGKSWGVRLHANSSKQLEVYAADEKPFDSNYDGTLTTANYAALYDKNTGWNKVDIHWRYATNGNVPVADIYLNGAFVEQLSLPKIPAQVDANIGIGGSTQDTPANNNTGGKGRRFRGSMDEVRLRAGVLSADWVKADYDTVNDETFVTVATPDVLTVAWANAGGAEPGLDEIAHDSVLVAGTVLSLGEEATACEIQCKVWADGAEEPAAWTTLTNGLVAADTFLVEVGGLSFLTTYNYALRAVDDDGAETDPVSGTFTTGAGLTIAWSDASGASGFSSVSYDFAVASGEVAAMGGAETCVIQGKVWLAGDAEPTRWTTLAEGLSLGDTFHATLRKTAAGDAIAPGTAYAYVLRAVGSDGLETESVSGTFATLGEEGEEIGSPYTHFFDDGTNALWVAKEFERFLPFTVTGYTGTETLTNFPVLVEVRKADTNGFSYDDFYHYDGNDIVFVDAKGRIIPHEIDTWNKNGMSMFWVRLPEMNNGTTFTMCYRSPLLETRPDPGNVFERYVGVWHMNETQDGVVRLKDSTVNDFETETHALSTASGNGRIGYARRVAQSPGSAASYGRIIAFDHDDILRTGVGNVFTYSGWYKLMATPPKWAYLVARKSEDADRGWGVQYDETSTARLRVWSGSAAKNAFQLFETPGASATGWNYWTFVFDGSVNPDGTTNQLFHAFLNGEELLSTSTNGGFRLNFPIANDETAAYDNLCVVGQQNGTGAFNGLVDEARYSKGIRSADWIRAEYDSSLQAANWNTDKRFVTKGTVSRGTDSLVPVVVWERGAGLPDTILDVSYAYVQFAGTVTYCGAGADDCRIEYQLWVDGENRPEEWTTLASGLTAGRYFAIPVTGLKQDMLYNFSIRAVNQVDGQERQNHEHEGQFRTNGNMELGEVDGELFRLGDRFVHRYRAGSWIFTSPDYVTNIEIMVVGGGGGGGYKVGGGGGGGGVFHAESFPVTTSTVYRVHVGQGGKAATDLSERSENGEISYFALASDEANPLIRMHGGGGGGSYVNNESVAKGADGASGGGGTYAFLGGTQAMMGLPEEFRPFGHVGGRGNDTFNGGSVGKVAAGGGGGAGRAGLGATFDQWSTGGSGGVGVENSMTGETLHYGAGGGGGYIYRMAVATDGSENFTKPGAGGSGIGGNAADVRNGTPATSGVPNTGAGGGGGSSPGNSAGTAPDDSDSTYWQGGDGGDGVVLISYEAHGRDPISDDPRISMTACVYTDEKGYADITYRAYWAGFQTEFNDLYVLYSVASSNEVAEGQGEWVRVETNTIAIGSTTFTPPEVGYTYWVRLVARKSANSFMYSDEIASFYVPAIRNNGATWHMPSEDDASRDYATLFYDLYYLDEDAHLYGYWSENEADLEGDEAPSGPGVHFVDFGTGRQAATSVVVPAAEGGFERNRTYYTRFATGNEAGTKYFLSPRIMVLDTIDRPRIIFPEATWANHAATVKFLATPAALDPASVEVLAFYSGVAGEMSQKTLPVDSPTVQCAALGTCADYPDDIETSTQFPLWSPVATNYYVRLALRTADGTLYPSQRYQTLELTGVAANTLLVFANAAARVGCYGDEPKPLEYSVSYGGLTNGVGWAHWESERGFVPGGALACEVAAQSPSGQYDIGQGTVAIVGAGSPYRYTAEAVVDPDTGETISEAVETYYYYQLVYCGAKYVVTNALFSAAVGDVTTVYTGEAFDVSGLVHSETGVRNDQPVSYQYRIGTNEWSDVLGASYTDVGTQTIQFKASAPNHDDATGAFLVTVEPTPLAATISVQDFDYTGSPRAPVVATNVTGLVRGDLNPLVCEFRDEAGEWQAEIPSFTDPGTYTLFFRASASNHVAAVASGTFTVVGWDYRINLDGESGYPTSVHISNPGWFLDVTGWTGERFAVAADRYAKLDEVQANGLKLWQNYVIDRADLGKRLVATVVQSGDRVNANAFVVRFPGVVALRNTGLSVYYRLDSKLRRRNDTEFVPGELTDKYETNVPLGPDDPTGLYVFNIVLVPTNALDTGSAVLSSVTTVGVLRVSSALTNTVTAVPWLSMAVDSTNETDIAVSDVVNPNGLSADSMILAYDQASGDFNGWTHASGTSWDALQTVTMNGVSVRGSAESSLARGDAFWLLRSEPADAFFLVGRATDEDYETELAGGTADEPGHTLVANPTMADIDLNELRFVDGEGKPATPAAGDRIVVQNLAGQQTIYSRNAANTAWGRVVATRVGGRVKQVWTAGGTIPSGTGFWYDRTAGGDLRIRFDGAK